MLLDKCLIWCIYLQDLQSDNNNFNEFDRAYIKHKTIDVMFIYTI